MDQHPEVQSQRLREAGCTRIFEDHGQSGAKASRPEWDRCLYFDSPFGHARHYTGKPESS